MLKSVQGFTLIELLIAVIIVGIVAAIALPSYTKQVAKSRRVDAKVALVELAQLQENHLADHNQFANNLGTGTGGLKAEKYGFQKKNCSNQPISDYRSKDCYYKLGISQVTGDGGFTLTATAVEKQADDKDCSQLKINAKGEKSGYNENNTENDDCW